MIFFMVVKLIIVYYKYLTNKYDKSIFSQVQISFVVLKTRFTKTLIVSNPLKCHLAST